LNIGAPEPGTTIEDHANTVFFGYNDLDSVEAAVLDAGEDDIAAIVCTPHRHDVFIDQELVDPEFARGVREICDRLGAMLIIDDVRCGPRIDLRGGWAAVGVKPDLSAWSKSLANGYPLAVLLGTAALAEAAAAVTATGSFWYAAAPMAAALTTMRLLKESNGIERMRASGLRLQEGLRAQAHGHDLAVSVTGPAQMPLMLFADDPEFARSLAWSGACAAHGGYLHPLHNWFLNTAHDEATIDEVLERTEVAFDEVRDRFGPG